jgi:peptidoglycan hydrolase CwlO-like protein
MLGALAVVLFLVAALLTVGLVSTRSHLSHSQATLATTQKSLTDTKASLATSQTNLAAAQAQIASLQADNGNLQAENGSLTGQLRASQRLVGEAQTCIGGIGRSIVDALNGNFAVATIDLNAVTRQCDHVIGTDTSVTG